MSGLPPNPQPDRPLRRLRIMIVAGEASGDAAGGELTRELRQVHNCTVYGIGGPRMRRAGAQLLYDSATWSRMGLTGSLGMVPRMLSTFGHIRRLLALDPPDVLVPIDFGAFNVPLARRARAQGVPVLYFMPPRSWDRNPNRRQTVAQVSTKIATPFPWSAELLRREGGDAEFVGHPLAGLERRAKPREAARTALGLAPDAPVVGLLPGSRVQEMKYVLPICLAAASAIREHRPEVQFVLGPAPSIPTAIVRRQMDRIGSDIPLARDMAYDIMSAAEVIVVASGTATLEAACLGTPMVVVYDGPATGRLEFQLLRYVKHVSLPNIIGGRTIVPELLGRSVATPARVADHALRLLDPGEARRQMLRDLQEVRRAIGPTGAIERTARLAVELAAESTGRPRPEEDTPSEN